MLCCRVIPRQRWSAQGVLCRSCFIPWTYGGKVVLAVPGGEKDTQYLTHVMAQQGITHCFLVPSQLDALLQVHLCQHGLQRITYESCDV